MADKVYFVYMMTNIKNTVLYTGITNDIVRRTYQHKKKLLDGFTTRYNLTKLVYYEEYTRVIDALNREKSIKNLKRVKKNALVEKSNPEWEDLYSGLLD